MDDLSLHYKRLLENWAAFARRDLFRPADRLDLMYYGTGTDTWGIQTHQKGFAAFAVLASLPDVDEKAAGMTRAELKDAALAMLRFTLASHKSGDYHCMEGDDVRWGHTWLTPLGVERMMHGVEALWDDLTDADRAGLRRMLISECDWTLDHRAVAGSVISPNVPESNIWCGAIMHRAAMMYPDCPRRAEYLERGTALLLNGLSIPSDATSFADYDGRPLYAWHGGANFYEDYALNHHEYLNVGYMVICLSNIAMLHFSCRRRGVEAPKALYHHMEALWRLIRACIFPDGRLFRIGGDTRVRYCYCQDYLLPSLYMIRDTLGDDCGAFETGWLDMLDRETAYNGDGSFLSKRCELMVERSPLYFARLESDRACTLSMACLWRRLFGEMKRPAGCGSYVPDPIWRALLNDWSNASMGGMLTRGEHRLASFVWQGAEPPTALIASPKDSSMVEWRRNLTGCTEGGGFINRAELEKWRVHAFEGGFATCGSYVDVTAGLLEENVTADRNVRVRLACAALPDGHTMVVLQWARAIRRCHLVSSTALNYMMPNDVFNGFRRDYHARDRWLTIDGLISLVGAYGGKPEVRSIDHRQIDLAHISYDPHIFHSDVYKKRGFLRCDEISLGRGGVRWYDAGETIYDVGAVLATELTDGETAALAAGCAVPEIDGGHDVRALIVCGQDGRRYLIAANFSDEDQRFTAAGRALALDALDVRVLALD
ncbi:MAG: hypothetical protein PUD68_02035 [Clostridiales bacterium]|nr:hypothetical protein [Clostridiales bacterium]